MVARRLAQIGSLLDTEDRIREALNACNREVHAAAARDPALTTMGTVAGVVVTGSGAGVQHGRQQGVCEQRVKLPRLCARAVIGQIRGISARRWELMGALRPSTSGASAEAASAHRRIGA